MNQNCFETSLSKDELLRRQIWALSHLFFIIISHELLYIFDAISIYTTLPWVMFILITCSFWKPHSSAFALLLIAQIIYAVTSLPDLQNHRYLTLFINVGLLLLYQKGAFFNQRALWFISRALIVVYFFAVFHKLNTAFFDPALSCATQFSNHIRLLFPEIPQLPLFEIYGTIIIETLLCLFLFSQKTWRLAAVIAIFFHLTLSFDYIKLFINFSGVMIGLVSIITVDAEKSNFFLKNHYIKIIPLLLASTLLLMKLLQYHQIFHIITVHCTLIAFSLGALLSIIQTNKSFAVHSSVAAACIVIVLFIDGSTPYLGIKNRGAFNMYSNLVITEDFSNHFIISRGLNIFGIKQKSESELLEKFLPFNPVDPTHQELCIW